MAIAALISSAIRHRKIFSPGAMRCPRRAWIIHRKVANVYCISVVLSSLKVTMNFRPLGRTGWHVSEISFGAWAIGGSWGHVSETDALAALHKAVDSGVNFI